MNSCGLGFEEGRLKAILEARKPAEFTGGHWLGVSLRRKSTFPCYETSLPENVIFRTLVSTSTVTPRPS